MGARHIKALTIRMQDAFCEQALFFGIQTGVRLDAYPADWMKHADNSNVHPFRLKPKTKEQKALLRLSLPANDNLEPRASDPK